MILKQLNEAISKKDQRAMIKEWRELAAELTVYEALVGKIAARKKELEAVFQPIAEEAASQRHIIDTAIIEVTTTKGRESVSYADLFKKALEIAMDDQKQILEDYKKAITKTGETKAVLKIVDSKLETALKDFNPKNMTIKDVKDKVREITALPPEPMQESVIGDAWRKVVSAVKGFFRNITSDLKRSRKSSHALLKIAKAE